MTATTKKKARKKVPEGYERIHLPMTPMIDVVFNLLIFFILTLKIVAPEGEFGINLPTPGGPGAPGSAPNSIPISLRANPDGTLAGLFLNKKALGNNSPQCFELLRNEIGKLVGEQKQFADDLAVDIDADYQLNYEYVIKAVSACRGKWSNGEIINYISKINLIPSQPPAAGE